MRRMAMVIDVAPEKLEAYRALHAAPWPGVLAALRRANIRNYSIHLKDRTLFSYFEYHGDDYEADMAGVAEDPETQAWWRLTDPCQAPWPSRAEGEWWASMEQIFLLE